MKSLLTFGQRTGYLMLNVGSALTPTRKDTLAERILDEADVHTLLAREPGRWNRVLLRLLYRAGLRVSEIAGLCWRDTHARDDGGHVTVFGKGGKTRTVLLPADVWRDLASLRGAAGLDRRPERVQAWHLREVSSPLTVQGTCGTAGATSTSGTPAPARTMGFSGRYS